MGVGENRSCGRYCKGWLGSARRGLGQQACAGRPRPQGPSPAPPPPPARGSARAQLSGGWAAPPPPRPRPTPASPSSPPAALLVSTSAVSGLTHSCRDIYRDSGRTLFSVLRKNSERRHPRSTASHPLGANEKSEGHANVLKANFSSRKPAV